MKRDGRRVIGLIDRFASSSACMFHWNMTAIQAFVLSMLSTVL